MAATNFNTENRTYRQLLGNGLTYCIPRFQRDYSWGEQEWEDIDTYLALTQPEGSQWSPAWKQSAQELRMFSVRQPYPMLMSARRRLTDADFESLLRATAVIAFRYNVIGAQHTSEQERVYHVAALQLHRGDAITVVQVLETLRTVYRSDEAFRADFAEKSIKTTQSRNAKIVRYILNLYRLIDEALIVARERRAA